MTRERFIKIMKFNHNCTDCIRKCKDHSMMGAGMWCPDFLSKTAWNFLLGLVIFIGAVLVCYLTCLIYG